MAMIRLPPAHLRIQHLPDPINSAVHETLESILPIPLPSPADVAIGAPFLGNHPPGILPPEIGCRT